MLARARKAMLKLLKNERRVTEAAFAAVRFVEKCVRVYPNARGIVGGVVDMFRQIS